MTLVLRIRNQSPLRIRNIQEKDTMKWKPEFFLSDFFEDIRSRRKGFCSLLFRCLLSFGPSQSKNSCPVNGDLRNNDLPNSILDCFAPINYFARDITGPSFRRSLGDFDLLRFHQIFEVLRSSLIKVSKATLSFLKMSAPCWNSPQVNFVGRSNLSSF